MLRFWILFLTLPFLIIYACNETTEDATVSDEPATDTAAVAGERPANCDEVEWTHKEGEADPANWAQLCKGFSACAGESQSPINIETAQVTSGENLPDINLEYSPSEVEIMNNGHTVQFNVSGNNKAIIGDQEFELLQFHYHAKSEHTIDGEYYPIEVHFVHRASDTNFAVIGIMYEEGAERDLLTNYLDKIPKAPGTVDIAGRLDLAGLMPSDLSYYHYYGSLTTPPCSEVVNWYVLKKPVEASENQIQTFAKILDNNYRPVMSLNNREVVSN